METRFLTMLRYDRRETTDDGTGIVRWTQVKLAHDDGHVAEDITLRWSFYAEQTGTLPGVDAAGQPCQVPRMTPRYPLADRASMRAACESVRAALEALAGWPVDGFEFLVAIPAVACWGTRLVGSIETHEPVVTDDREVVLAAHACADHIATLASTDEKTVLVPAPVLLDAP